MSDKPNLTRRGLFGGLSTQAKAMNIRTTEKVQRSVARPPTAVDEDIFQRLCNQCGECAKVCPQDIIHIQNGYPTLDVDYAHCTLCGECKKVCPTIALSGEQQDTGLRAQVNDTCINRYGYCDACESSCPSQALKWQDGARPSIELANCNGCGACKPDCYIGAISLS
ncbi:ferredoxin-type protein NapF [Vibrio algicola]|uniref:Ferredoxin-type protein NapF n=1 Tax=Vibrio algicola TaxID=2662262 RepID=A0A5Q0TG77_9VIBR|nr:ferredoxin-type protein NapF [Vibrio algicola]